MIGFLVQALLLGFVLAALHEAPTPAGETL